MGSHRTYKIEPEQRVEFASMYLLFEMVENDKRWNVELNRDNGDFLLENNLGWLLGKGYAEIDGVEYTYSDKGYKIIEKFNERDIDFIRRYDVFCAVDTDRGEFAFSEMLNMDDDQWSNYLQESRWVDLRTVVAEFHKIDPIQMIFISFIRDGVINSESEGWQFALCMGEIFDEIEDIINSMFNLEDFAIGDLSAEEHISRYLEKANDVMRELAEQRELLSEPDDNIIDELEVVEETTTYYQEPSERVVTVIDPYDDWYFYDRYYDVEFVSPCWNGGLYVEIDLD